MSKSKTLLILVLLFLVIRYIKVDEIEEESIQNKNTSSSYNSYNSHDDNNSTIPIINNESKKYIAYLNIPKINLYKGLVDINSNDNNVDRNIQIINGSGMPDIEKGNLILAAHSGNSNVSFFRDLNKLIINDSIYIEYNNKSYEYRMIDYYIVEKTGYIDIIRNENINTLTLITCIENTNKQIIFICELNKITDL